MKMRTLGLFAILCLAMAAPMTNAYSGGIYGQGTGCGGGYCHGSGTQTATLSMSGQPTAYAAGTTYTLTVSVTGGASSTNGGFALDIDKGSLSSPGTGVKSILLQIVQHIRITITEAGVSIGQLLQRCLLYTSTLPTIRMV